MGSWGEGDLERVRGRLAAMLDDLATLVDVESPSADLAATAACAGVLAELGRERLGAEPEAVVVDDRTHLLWRFGAPRVLLLGHFDTVWPTGTVARWPFAVRDGVATGPGTFDMKGGIVVGLHALAEVRDRVGLDGVAVLMTSDEEVGSTTSRALIEATAAGLDAVLVLEPPAGAAIKVGRKGVSDYRLAVEGRAAHAGLEPEKGVNALVELAHQVLAVQQLARPDAGTTVTPTVGGAGTTVNVVPAHAWLEVDVRAASAAEQERVDAAMCALSPVLPGATLGLRGGVNRPPMEEHLARPLYERAARVAERLGLPPLEATVVGGASDGNFTAAIGVPTLDGLGAVGDGAHAEGEHVSVSALPERAALVAGLLTDLLAGP